MPHFSTFFDLADFGSENPPQEARAFWQALKSDDFSEAKALFKPAFASMKDSRKSTPLMLAAINDCVEGVHFLLPLSDANAQDIDGCTALMSAFQGAALDSARLLIPQSDLSLRNREGKDALQSALHWLGGSGAPTVVEFFSLFFPGSDPERAGVQPRAQSAMDLAILFKNWPLVDLFSQHVGDASARALHARLGDKPLPALLARIEAEILRDQIASAQPALGEEPARQALASSRLAAPRL